MLQNAGTFICLYPQCSEGKADREVTETSSKQCKQIPGKWLNKPGEKLPKQSQVPASIAADPSSLPWGREHRGRAAAGTHTLSPQATPPPSLPRKSSFYKPSQTSGQRRRVSSSSSCIYHKNHIPPESKVKTMERQTKHWDSLILTKRHGQKHFFLKLLPLLLLYTLKTFFSCLTTLITN